jgi:uracil-DNA glycosylase
MQFTEQQLNKLNKIQIDESWKYSLSEFLLGQKMDNLREFLQQEKLAQKRFIRQANKFLMHLTPLHLTM